jgi:hypothetical protein
VIQDGSIYSSVGSSNTNNNPTANDGNWEACVDLGDGYDWTGPHTYTLTPTVSGNAVYHAGNFVAGTDYQTPIRTVLQSPASQTLQGSAGTGTVITEINNGNASNRVFTLDASTFAEGDIVIIRVLAASIGTTTITTDSGLIYLSDGTGAASHIIPENIAMTAEFHKINSTNWRCSVY